MRYLGSITAINGNTLTVKTDAGDVHQVQVPSTAILKRIAPGQTDLTKAEPLDFSSLATGDRVLVTLDPNATGGTPQAARIIAIKQTDVAKRQETENAVWNQGVHGLVKSVDGASGVIVVTTRTGTITKDVTVNTTSATVLKRYAPGSVRFDQAQPAPIAAIQTGDQVWARGTKSADGSTIAADGVVSGSFRSIPGTVISVDPAASTVTVKDLSTKKPVTVRVSADAQLRRLDSNVATVVATRLKGNASGGRGGNTGGGAAGGGGQRGPGAVGGPGGGRMDLETFLERAPQIQLSDLKKDDAVMIVATQDASGLSAVKLLAGVEPLLEAPEAQDLLSSWSLSSGESEAAAQ
jgi:transcription antitermination factor NusG